MLVERINQDSQLITAVDTSREALSDRCEEYILIITPEVQWVKRVNSQLDPWKYFNTVIEYGRLCLLLKVFFLSDCKVLQSKEIA